MLALGAGAFGSDQVSFSRDVKPILSNNCFACHGPDEERRKARLRLDTHEGATAELRSGDRAIVPGDPAHSTVIARVTSDDDLERMPPPRTGKSLTPEQVETVRRWIQQGAKYDAHWAYTRPARPQTPEVADRSWGANAIDAFVLARLEAEKLTPAPEADRRTLIRRLAFDLTGLPPTPEQVRAFVEDALPDAYGRLVEDLLGRPQYGERMAMYWLDLVRYADSNGYHSDNPREVSAFRDYVIRAFNDNKPFDWFTIEQLAGDLLPGATLEQRIASGYNRLSMTTEEGGAQPKEYIAKYLADRVRNASTIWLGATLGCAECHDHKFDPYTTRDFYRFGAFFADLDEVPVGKQQAAMIPLPTSAQASELQRLESRLAALKRRLETTTPELEAAQARWEQEQQGRGRPWKVLQPLVYASQGGAKLSPQADGSIQVGGPRPETDTYTITAHTRLVGITGIRLEVFPGEKLPQKGPGRSRNGNFVLSEFTLQVGSAEEPGALTPVALRNAAADFSQDGYPVAHAIDGNPATGWAILPQVGRAHVAVFETVQDVGNPNGAALTITLSQQYPDGHSIGRFRLSVTHQPRPVPGPDTAVLPLEIAAILGTATDKRTDPQRQALNAHFRSIAPQLTSTREEIGVFEKRIEAHKASIQTMLVASAVEPRVVRVLPRGNWMDESGEIVQPDVPGALPPLGVTDRRANRLDLARWLVSPENPLTARVFVNRLWMLFFGRGLAMPLDDLGVQGEVPSHPALLDWMATEFIDSGYDMRHMVRLLVTSRAYRMSSRDTEELRTRDPGNRLIARQGRFRIEAEMVRDNALAISGLLSMKIGGPSVKPYQPDGYWSFLNFPKREWVADKGEDQYRRGLYTFWQRTFLHPSLLAFDACTREEATAERVRSNTPLQALVLLNDPTYVEAARVFAARIIREGGSTPAARIAFAMQQAVQRDPAQEEMNLLAQLCEKHGQQYAADRAAAEALLKVGDTPAPAEMDAVELAAWTSVARVILNLHETITRN